MATHSESNRTSKQGDQSPAETAMDRLALYHRVAERSPLPMAMSADWEHMLYAANPAFCELLGTELPTLLGQSFVDVLPSSATEQLRSLLDDVYRTDTPMPALTMDLTQAERDHRSWTATIWPIPDNQGSPAGFVMAINDTTAHQRDEQAWWTHGRSISSC